MDVEEALKAYKKSEKSTNIHIQYTSILNISVVNALLNNDIECKEYLIKYITIITKEYDKSKIAIAEISNFLAFNNSPTNKNYKLLRYLSLRQESLHRKDLEDNEYKLIIYTLLHNKSLFNENKSIISKKVWFTNTIQLEKGQVLFT